MLNLQQKIEIILQRRGFFDLHFPPIDGCDALDNVSNSCPSCGYMTLSERGASEICSFCFWQDDGQDNSNADEALRGPNGRYPLTTYREELFDWMEKVKKQKSDDDELEFSIGQELIKLDQLMQAAIVDKRAVTDQITVVSECFYEHRESKNS